MLDPQSGQQRPSGEAGVRSFETGWNGFGPLDGTSDEVWDFEHIGVR